MKALIFVGLLLLPFSVVLAEPTAPRLFFEYSWLYDANCPQGPSGPAVDPAWAREARLRTSDFGQAWEKSSPVLWGKVFELFGKGFQRKELTATLSVCPRWPSFSNPLVLNVTRFLKSYMKDKPIRSEDSFVDLVFHETLHTWLVENLKLPTPLLKKYESESPAVRSHLHLIAMQIYIYTELQRPDLLLMISQQYSQVPVPAYSRAWEIVAKIEGHEAFIAEIKN